MRVNTNVSAMNTLRQLGKSSAGMSQAIGRLSSGFRINRAADDAAGLGIANKMRADIRSMQQAARNAEQANSLLQTAEGGLQTISNILDRMKELATQAGSDSVDVAGQGRIKSEWDELVAEVDMIADTTKFQGRALLNGTFGNAVTVEDFAETVIESVSPTGGANDTYTLTSTAAGALTLTNSTGSVTQVVTGLSDGKQTVNFDRLGITVVTGTSYDADAVDNINAAEDAATADFTVAGTTASFLVRSSGSYATDDTISLSGLDVQSATLGIDGASVNPASTADWQAALTVVDSAIATLNTAFGNVGAAQNRIAYAKSNTDVSVENFQAAESIIRDADMAFEVTQMTKFQILQQAGTSVLAQANQSTQNVLSLLR